MKKFFFFVALLFCIGKMNAQIVAQHTFPRNMRVYKFESGLKYVLDSSNTSIFNLKIYNTDFTLFESINFPNPYPQYSMSGIFYLSDNLFDLDPQIEFGINYYDGPSNARFVIFNDNGSTIFNKQYGGLTGYTVPINQTGPYGGIIPTPDGTVMMVSFSNTNLTKVYSLPGSLPCWECSDGDLTGNRPMNSGDYPEGINSQIFPNPSSSQTEIAYELPDGCRQATLKVFSIEGTLLKTFTITSDFDNIVLSNEDLAAGTYFYKIETPKGESYAKKFVIVQQ